MDVKDNQTQQQQPINKAAAVPIPPIQEDSVIYIAVRGSLHANDCCVFGLEQQELKAISKKYSATVIDSVVNGLMIKINVLEAINSLAQLGYKVISSTGESDITWTLLREI